MLVISVIPFLVCCCTTKKTLKKRPAKTATVEKIPTKVEVIVARGTCPSTPDSSCLDRPAYFFHPISTPFCPCIKTDFRVNKRCRIKITTPDTAFAWANPICDTILDVETYNVKGLHSKNNPWGTKVKMEILDENGEVIYTELWPNWEFNFKRLERAREAKKFYWY